MGIILSEARFEELRLERERTVLAAASERQDTLRFMESKYESDSAIIASVEDLKKSSQLSFLKLLDIKTDQIAVLDEVEFKGAISDHLILQLQKRGYPLDRLDLSMKACFDYVRDFLFDLCLMRERAEIVVREPYVHAWKIKGQHDVAGDAALFGYLAYYKKRGNHLTRSDYMDLCVRSHYDWYGQGLSHKRHNVGKYVAERLPKFFPIIQDFPIAPFRNRLRGI